MAGAPATKVPSDKRSSRRRRCRTQVRIWNEHFEASCFTADVSNSGLLVETTRRIPIGTRVHIEVKVGERSFFSEATVARRLDYPGYAQSVFKPALGLRFVGLGEALRDLEEEQAAALLQAVSSADAQPGDAGSAFGQGAASEPGPAQSAPERKSEAPLNGEFDAVVDLRDAQQLRVLYDRDLSKGGLLVETRELAQIGAQLRVVLRLPPGHGDIPVRGTVVSAFSDSLQVGLLLDERKELRRRLLEILDSAA